MSKKKGCLAIIPARGGSKRIPFKNIKEFCGKPIISYSIECASSSGMFTEIMVSTDDAKIAEISKKYGAKVPFFRSELNSGDHATLAEVVTETLDKYSKTGICFDTLCLILPTAPFLTPETISRGRERLLGGNFDAAFSIVKFSYPIYRALKSEGGKISMIWPENINKRSQDLAPAFHDAGQFYWLKASKFMEEKKIFMANSGGVELPESMVQDIDTEEDWKIAEFKYKYSMELKNGEK